MTEEDLAAIDQVIADLRERIEALETFAAAHRHALSHDVILTGHPEPPFGHP